MIKGGTMASSKGSYCEVIFQNRVLPGTYEVIEGIKPLLMSNAGLLWFRDKTTSTWFENERPRGMALDSVSTC